jgi:hypothetical protein
MSCRILSGLCVLSLCCLLAGCSSSTKTYPVTGKVLVNGQPAGGAVVVLSLVSNPGTMDKKPSGIARDDGTFVLSTFGSEDGAPPGEYYVTVFWPAKPKGPGGQVKGFAVDERSGDAPDQLNGKYRDPKSSGLKVTIKAERNELPPFELKN